MIIREKKILQMLDVSRSTLKRLEVAGLFPKRIKVGLKAVGWLEADVVNWLESKILNRGKQNESK